MLHGQRGKSSHRRGGRWDGSLGIVPATSEVSDRWLGPRLEPGPWESPSAWSQACDWSACFTPIPTSVGELVEESSRGILPSQALCPVLCRYPPTEEVRLSGGRLVRAHTQVHPDPHTWSPPSRPQYERRRSSVLSPLHDFCICSREMIS